MIPAAIQIPMYMESLPKLQTTFDGIAENPGSGSCEIISAATTTTSCGSLARSFEHSVLALREHYVPPPPFPVFVVIVAPAPMPTLASRRRSIFRRLAWACPFGFPRRLLWALGLPNGPSVFAVLFCFFLWLVAVLIFPIFYLVPGLGRLETALGNYFNV
ncbi:hypothetical protein JX266_002431 [Neoarthrinium moseri]|nr:hypothetical protein JX266_002431 [Neoarthrinium moseri]